jgi:capsular polysaccharide export protein
MSKRNFLFLQAVCSPFFPRLADRLLADGHQVLKVNFNTGDMAYWGGRKSVSFRGRPQDLRDFLDDIYRQHGISDQVLFGDRRPVHRPAVEHAEALGIRTHVFEEGYFRPHWITLEREGVNGHSLLPRDPEWFWTVGGDLGGDERVEPFASPFWVRGAHDVAYHLAGVANPLLFPHYRSHSPISAPVEYLGYLRRFALQRGWELRDMSLIESLVVGKHRYYVLPLQLNIDAQIRDHSRFESMAEVMAFVIESFARQAPAGSRLVIKNHPLDMGLVGYGRVIESLAREYDVNGRIDYLESGDLEWLVCHARGLVTVNSTVGSVSLGLDCPTATLSDPIYNLPGLTFQGPLDDFWRQGEAPNRELFRRFRNVVMRATQVNGGFYSREGINLAVKNSVGILENETSPLESLN